MLTVRIVYVLCTQAQLQEMYAQMVYKDHKIVELNTRLMDQDGAIMDLRELVCEKDEVIRGRDMAIQLLQASISRQTGRLHDQEALIARLSAKVDRAEVELSAFHERLLESDGGDDRSSFADQLRTVQENFAELLMKKDKEMSELRQRVARHEEMRLAEAVAGLDSDSPSALRRLRHDMLEAEPEVSEGLQLEEMSVAETAADVNTRIDSAALSAVGRSQVGTSAMRSDGPQLSSRLLELEAEVERLRASLLWHKDDMLASSHEQLLAVQAEVRQLRGTVASSSEASLYTTASEMSLLETRVEPGKEETGLMETDGDSLMAECERQVDRSVWIMRPKQTCVLTITAEQLQGNVASEEDEVAVKSRLCVDESGVAETMDLLKLNDELLSLHRMLEAKEAELERLRKEVLDVRRELAMKEEECTELTESVASLNDSVPRQQSVQSEFLCEELRKELAATREVVGAKDVELERLHGEISVTCGRLSDNEKRCSELSDSLEESRSAKIETEKLLEAHEQEVSRLNDLVSTLQTSPSEMETPVVEMQQRAEGKSQNGSQQVEDLSAELAEVRKLHEEANSLVAEKTARFAELSEECCLLRETVEKYRTSEEELTGQIEAVMEGRAKDLEKFNADLDLVRTEATEKQRQIDGMVQTLSEKDENASRSLREVESLTEVISQMQASLGNKREEIELLTSETMEKDSRLEGMYEALLERDAYIAGSLREIESLTETVSQLRTCVQSRDEEIERLQSQMTAGVRRLSGREHEGSEITASFGSFNESDIVLSQQQAGSQSSREEIGDHLTADRDQTGAEEQLESRQSQYDVSSAHRKFAGTEEESKELLPSMEESARHLVVRSEHILEKPVVEISEWKGDHEEMRSVWPQKASSLEELQVTAAKLKNTERRLTARKQNDLQKFTADLDLLKTQIAEKDQQLEGMIQALSEQDTKIAGRLGEIGSLRESVSQLAISVVSRSDEIERQKCVVEEQEANVEEKELESCSEQFEQHEVVQSEFVSQLSDQNDAVRSMELQLSESSSAVLRSELTEAKAHITAVELELEQLRAAVVQSRDELTSKEDACKELTCLLAESRTLEMDKDRLLSEKTTGLEVLLQECELLRDSISKFQKTEQEFSAQLKSKEDDLVKTYADLDLAVAKMSEKEQQLEEILQQLSEKDASIAQNVREFQSLSETVASLQTSLQDKDEEVELVKSGALETGQRLEGLIESLSGKDADIAAGRQEIESLTESISELQTSLQSKDEELSEQKLVVQERDMRIMDQDSEMGNCYRKLEEHDVMNTEFVGQLSEQQGVIKSLKDELARQTDDAVKDLQLLQLEVAEKHAKVSEMSETIASLNESSCVLREQLTTSESWCEELRQELTEMKAQSGVKDVEIDTLQEAISASCDELARKEEELTQFATSFDESSVALKRQLAESELACERLRNELTETRAEAEAKTVELERLRGEISASGDALAANDERCKELSRMLEESKGFIAEKENLLENYLQEREELRRQGAETASLLAEKTSQFDELSQECYLLRDAAEKYKIAELEWSSRVELLAEGKADDLERFSAELQLLRDESLANARQIEDADKCIERLKVEISGRDESILQLTESVASLSNSTGVLGEQLAQSEALREELGNELAKRVDEIGEKNAEFGHLDAEVGSLRDAVSTGRAELAAKDEECEQLLKNIGERLSELELLRTELVAAGEQIGIKELELGKLRDVISSKDTELTSKEEEYKELCEELRNDLAKCRHEIGEKDAELGRLDAEVDSLRDAVSTGRAELAAKDEERKQLLKNSRDQLAQLEMLRTELTAANDQIETKNVETGKLGDDISAQQTELTSKDEVCRELTERVESLNECLNVVRQRLAESESSREELRAELGTYKDQAEAEVLEEVERLARETSPGPEQSTLLLEESHDPRAENVSPLEASSLETCASLSRVEPSVENASSDGEMAACMYDVVECVRPPSYRITSQTPALGDTDVARMMQCWRQFSSLLSAISANLEHTATLTRQRLAAGSEVSSSDSGSVIPPPCERDLPDNPTTSLIPLSTLTAMEEHVITIRRHIERHDCRNMLVELSQDAESLRAQLAEYCQSLDERDRELESARLEMETCSLRFEKLKSKSVSKVKELSEKHQAAMEQKEEEASELRRKLEDRERQVVAVTEKSESLLGDMGDVESRCLAARTRVDELETLLADKNSQIQAMSEQVGARDSEASVLNSSVGSSVPVDVSQNAPLEETETQRTGVLGSSSPHHSGTAAAEDVQWPRSDAATDAGALRRILLNTGQILASLLSDDDSSPTQSDPYENDLSCVEQYAERCREMVRDLKSTSELGAESRLQAVTEELAEKKVLANKYAAAAKKLKQQLDQSKKDLSDAGDQLKDCREQIVELTTQLSTSEEQYLQKEAELKHLQESVSSWNESLTEMGSCSEAEITRLKESNAALEAEVLLRRKEIVDLNVHVSALEEQCSQKELDLKQLQQSFDALSGSQKESLLEIESRSRADIADLTQSKAELEAELSLRTEELKGEVSRRNEVEEHLSRANEDLQREKDELEASGREEIASLKEKNTALEAEILLGTKQIDDLKAQLSMLEEQFSLKEAELKQQLVDALQSWMEIESRSQVEIAKLEAEVLLRIKEFEEVKAQMTASEERCSQKEAELKELRHSADSLTESHRKSLAEFESRSQAEISDLKESSASLEAEILLRTTELDDSKAEIERRSQTEQRLSRVNQDLQQLLREKDEQLGEIEGRRQSEIAELTEGKAALEAEILLRTNEIEDAKSEVNNRSRMNEDLQQLLRERDDEMGELRAESDADKAKVVSLQQTVDSQTAQLDAVFAANQELKNLLQFNDRETGELVESQTQQLATELSVAHDRLDRKTRELNELAAENTRLLRRLDDKDAEICQCVEHSASLKHEIESLQGELTRRSEMLKQNADELASLTAAHETDVCAVEEKRQQLSALQTELEQKNSAETELQRKSCETEAALRDVSEELSCERLLSEQLRTECESLAAAVRHRDEELCRLHEQIRSADDKLRSSEMLIAELEQKLSDTSARLGALESDSEKYRQQVVELQTSVEQRDEEPALLKSSSIEQAAQLEITRSAPDKTASSAEMVATWSGDRTVTMTTVSVETCDAVGTADDELLVLAARNSELAQENARLLAEIATVGHRVADLEVENCTLRNSRPSTDAVSAAGNTRCASASDADRLGRDGSAAGNTELASCRLAESGPAAGVVCISETSQARPAADLQLPDSSDLSSLREKYSQLESDHASLKEELSVERQNSSRFVSIERLKEGLEAEHERNLAEIESLTATKAKMLAKLKQLKLSNDQLTGEVDQLRHQLETTSAQMESETRRLSGCVDALEVEKRSWHSTEADYRAALSNVRDELARSQLDHAEAVKSLADVQLAADAERCGLQQQLSSAQDEWSASIADYEAQLSSVRTQKDDVDTYLEQVSHSRLCE